MRMTVSNLPSLRHYEACPSVRQLVPRIQRAWRSPGLHDFRRVTLLPQPGPSPTTALLELQRFSRRRRRGRQAVALTSPGQEVAVPAGSVSVVLLAGGVGKRMGAAIPKQYLTLSGIPIAVHSLLMFASMPEVREIIIVCEQQFRSLFLDHFANAAVAKSISFAQPGIERQDSVYSGLQAISANSKLVAIHDSARPLITAIDARRCMHDALQVGAAVLGVAVKPTIKQVDVSGRVVTTLQRAGLWEVQTPQVIRPVLLRQGFQLVQSQNLAVTDDVSIIEALGLPVQVTPGSYTNIKVTTPDDMMVAEGLLSEHRLASQQQIAALQPA